jgi:hypothetical protein
MQRAWPLVSIVVVIAACGSSSATASAQCGPSAARTLAANRLARVYTSKGSTYGCANAVRRSYLLSHGSFRPGRPRIGKLALAGTVVAYGETITGVDTAGAQVIVRRLDNGQTLRSLAAMSQPLGPESFQSVDSIVVRSDGAVAWIAMARSIIRHSTQTEVDRADRRGRATLDAGSGIDSASLRLTGSSLSWRHGGVRRTARLA